MPNTNSSSEVIQFPSHTWEGPTEDQRKFVEFMLREGLNDKSADVSRAAQAVNVDPRTAKGWYVDKRFRAWVEAEREDYHRGMAELFAMRLYEEAAKPGTSINHLNTTINAGLKVAAAFASKKNEITPEDKKEFNASDIINRMTSGK